jgi:DNA-binding transcriptional LysR family regulator
LRAGFGIGLCQIGLARRDPNLLRLLPDIEFGMQTFVVMHEDLKSNRRCRVVFDALVAGMSDYVAERQ